MCTILAVIGAGFVIMFALYVIEGFCGMMEDDDEGYPPEKSDKEHKPIWIGDNRF